MVCQDAAGRSSSYCDERVKPAESKSCDSGPCPLWNYGVWGEVRLSAASLSFRPSLQQVGIRNLLFPLSVHPNLRRGAEDSPRGVSEAQRPEAQRLQLRRPGQAARHGAVQPAALPGLCLLAPPTLETGTIVELSLPTATS